MRMIKKREGGSNQYIQAQNEQSPNPTDKLNQAQRPQTHLRAMIEA